MKISVLFFLILLPFTGYAEEVKKENNYKLTITIVYNSSSEAETDKIVERINDNFKGMCKLEIEKKLVDNFSGSTVSGYLYTTNQ